MYIFINGIVPFSMLLLSSYSCSALTTRFLLNTIIPRTIFKAVQMRESGISSPDIAIHAADDEHSSATNSLLLLAALGLMVDEDELRSGVASEN